MRALACLVATLLVTSKTLDFAADPPVGESAPNAECVVVLHGLARTSRSMSRLAARLADAGFGVDNLDYPSTRRPFDELVSGIAEEVKRISASCAKIHFVGYSLGALIVRAYLQRSAPPELGRVVMIGPPNHGSEIVDLLGKTHVFRAIFGPVGAELGTSPGSLPNRLGPPSFEFGVIAGNRWLNPLGWWLIPGDNDGEVSVASTRLENMSDFVVVARNHTFMMNAPEVAAQVVAFLRFGHFEHVAPRAEPARVGGFAGLWLGS